MRKINMENVREAGTSNRLPAGGYICKITNVTDVPLNENTGRGDYLEIEFDIAEGEYKDYYKQINAEHGFWGGSYKRSYKEKALPFFKRMCSAVAKSNPGFVFDGGEQNSNEQTLVGKRVGLVLGEEEYNGNDGKTKTRLYVSSECSIEDIQKENFKVPEFKNLDGTRGKKEKTTNYGFVSEGFTSVEENIEIPF